MSRRKIDAIDRIKKKTKYVGECWVYMGDTGKLKNNSPRVWTGVQYQILGKYIFNRLKGTLKGDNVACHTCDNNRCWNPDHLYEGTHSSNAWDKISRGRDMQLVGVQRWNAVLNEEIVRDIKIRLSRGGIPSHIANKLGLSASLVKHVANGESWNHVTI